MPRGLQRTLKSLQALAGDHRSGAAEIAYRAAALVEEFCRHQRPSDPRLPDALSTLAETTLRVQPSMAPLLNLANQMQLAAENGTGVGRLRWTLAESRRRRRGATAEIARRFAARLPKRPATVLTYSYSSTVLAALQAGAGRLARVILSEARPIYEGRLMAERLAAKGIPVTLLLDAALPDQVAAVDTVVVGADTVLANAYVNKVGTRRLQEEAHRARKPFFVLADTSKLLPPALERFHHFEKRPAREVWRQVPAHITVVNCNSERIPVEPHVTLLSQHGRLPPARLRGLIEKLPVARRWSRR